MYLKDSKPIWKHVFTNMAFYDFIIILGENKIIEHLLPI